MRAPARRQIAVRPRRWPGLTAAALTAVVLAWLTVQHARRETPGGAPRGPSQIIMSQRLTEAVPPRLAGLARTAFLGETPARTAIAALQGSEPPLLRACGGQYDIAGSVALWVGEALSAEAARQMVDDARARPGAVAVDDVVHLEAAGRALAVFARRARVYWLQADGERLPAALMQLRDEGPRRGRGGDRARSGTGGGQ